MSNGSLENIQCPRCDTKLENIPTKHGVVWSCFNCKGRAIGVGLLQKISDPALIQQIWIRAKQENNPTGAPCPACRQAMLIVTTSQQLGSVELDVCHSCFFIWFDHHELDKVPKASDSEIAKRTAASEPKIQPPSTTESSDRYDYDDSDLFDIADMLENWIRWRF